MNRPLLIVILLTAVLFAACKPQEQELPEKELVGTYWRLDMLGEESVATPEGMKEAHMILAGDESRVHGHAGCNNFFGQFTTDESTLSFSTLGATRMACPDAMDTEQSFLAALEGTARYQISGLFLDLYDAEGTLLARLEADYP